MKKLVRMTLLLAGASWLVLPTSALAAGDSAGKLLSLPDLVATVVYGLLGIALAMAGYFIYDLVTPFSVTI